MLEELHRKRYPAAHTVWWECPNIQRYWQEVSTLISTVCNVPSPLTPLDLPLGLNVTNSPNRVRILVTHILIAARLALAKKWKSPQPPNRLDLIILLNNHLQMEFSFAKTNLTTAPFLQNWEPWITDYSTVMNITPSELNHLYHQFSTRDPVTSPNT